MILILLFGAAPRILAITTLALCALPTFAEYPPHPYSAIWNYPTTECFGDSLDLSKFKIMQNQKDAINGGNITMFPNLGQFPVWGTRNMTIINGGIPQLGNLSLHLEMAQRDIVSLIPDRDFAGLAAIDFRAWKPLYQQNFGELEIYKTESRIYTQERHPNLNSTELEKQAKKEFDEAARSFLEGTLLLALRLRPGGLWGYVGYPYCYAVSGYYCDDMGVQENKEIQWIFDASSALYPTEDHGQIDAVIDLVSVVHESHRIIAGRNSSTPLYLYLYTRYTYVDNPAKFYTKDDIEQSTIFATMFGVDGVVVFGTTMHTTSKSLCDALLKFINSMFGPLTKSAYDWQVGCSQSMCSGHGMCVDLSEGGTLRQEGQPYLSMFKTQLFAGSLQHPLLYKCRCYYDWRGEQCQTPV